MCVIVNTYRSCDSLYYRFSPSTMCLSVVKVRSFQLERGRRLYPLSQLAGPWFNFLRHGLVIWLRLAMNSPSLYLSLPSAEITSVSHFIQFSIVALLSFKNLTIRLVGDVAYQIRVVADSDPYPPGKRRELIPASCSLMCICYTHVHP